METKHRGYPVLPIFFEFPENFIIFSCCVVICENITLGTSNITRYKNVQGITI